ncbi:MAG: pyridoxamine 5'-phosphate oxidase [Flavobacteriales bacterium]|nr:pyridoxamine 5'-phosphate oxidase [Flavobacteriales bacterium]
MEPNPLELFGQWYAKAEQEVKNMPEAVCLATASKSGRPSARMVLLKSFDEKGFVFFTNYESRKGHELEENPQAFLLFYWKELGRQVRVEGQVEKVSAEESDAYFATRPRQSQLGAWASKQSRPISSRIQLLRSVAKSAAQFLNKPVERPDYWGGFRIIPDRYEFWEDQQFRLHNRFDYQWKGDAWEIKRLSP